MTTIASSRSLTGSQKKFLKGLAHSLDPVVRLGNQGLNDAIVEKTAQELASHELIKVKVGDGCSDPTDTVVGLLADATQATVVQVIGHVGVLYKRRKKDATIVLPKPSKTME